MINERDLSRLEKFCEVSRQVASSLRVSLLDTGAVWRYSSSYLGSCKLDKIDDGRANGALLSAHSVTNTLKVASTSLLDHLQPMIRFSMSMPEAQMGKEANCVVSKWAKRRTALFQVLAGATDQLSVY